MRSRASAPDGYTTLFSSLSLLVNAIVAPDKVKYDPFKDFAPVSNAAVLPMVVVTSPETRIGSMQDLLARAKAKPGEITYGTPGQAGSAHLAGAMLENLSGTKMTNVPFKGNAPALAEVMAGRVTFMFYPIDRHRRPRAGRQAQGARGRDGGSRIRTSLTCRRWGSRDSPASRRPRPGWGCSSPPGRRRRSSIALARKCASRSPGRRPRDRMKTLGAITVADTPAEFLAFLKKDYERWARVIKAAGIKSE